MTDTENIPFPGYTLLSQLGSGGLSKVFLANQNVFQRQVAFKVMSANMARQEGFGERFLREARIVANLNHRNIVQVYDTGVTDGNYFLAMEFLPKGDLSALTGRPFAPRDALRVASSVLEALEFAASRGVVHRDVKPANVMFREDNTVVLVDFGIAFRDEADERVTRVGTIIGTPRYMSPEQFQGGHVDERSDIYSVGIMLFELLTGELPFDADTAVAIGIQHMGDPVPRLPEPLAPFQEIIDTALAKRPEDRFSGAAEFLAALAGLSGSVYAGNGLAGDATLVEQLATIPLRVFGDSMASGTADSTLPGDGGALEQVVGAPTLIDDDALALADGVSAPARTPRRKRRRVRDITESLTQVLELPTSALVGIGVALSVAAIVVTVLMFRVGTGERDDAPAGAESATAGSSSLRTELIARRDDLLELAGLLQPVDAQWAPSAISAAYEALLSRDLLRESEAVLADEARLQGDLSASLRSAKRRFRVGSSAEQITQAHRACLQLDPTCERSNYESEASRVVVLSPFRLQQSEATVAQFEEFTRSTAHVTEAERRGYSYVVLPRREIALRLEGLSWRKPFPGSDERRRELPAVHLSSADARAYCRWRGGRLPTPEEWEYAARGPERRVYTWGDRWNAALAPVETSRPRAAGSLPQDAFFSGLTEMTGNVWEWVSLGEGRYALKGGSHREISPVNMRTAARRDVDPDDPDATASDEGVRCAFSVPEWPATRFD